MTLRPLLAAAVLAGLLLAGCAQRPSDAPGPGQVPSPLATPQTSGLFHTAGGLLAEAPAGAVAALGGAYHIGLGATEPTLGVDPKGAVYMTASLPGGIMNGGGPTIVRSTDKGQTWKAVGPRLPQGTNVHPASFDPYVFVDAQTGRIYMDDLLPISCSVLSWSDDQGETWLTNPYACGHTNVNDHQTITTGRPRLVPAMPVYPNVLYFCSNNVYDTACATSFDGGLTFNPQVPAYPGVQAGSDNQGQGLCGGLSGHVKTGPDGRAYLPKGQCGFASVAVSDNDGLTWTQHTIDTRHRMTDHEVSIAVDEANTVYATWPAADGFVYYSFSRDAGATWSPALNLTAPGVTATAFNAVAAGGPGKVAFAYIGTTVPGGYAGKPKGAGGLTGDIVGEPDPPEWANATWNAYVGVITDATSESPVIQTVTANDPSDPLARGLCGGTRCHGMNDFIDLVIDGEGRPWGAFVDVCTKKCVSETATHWDTAEGLVATLRGGPALRGPLAQLPLLAAQAQPS
ncbi:MAG TPA: sialidase family protein [Candidatus Thermoplasmatota archaeon]|nr:sialidase family protein [Candidatus Thermoplasmatota archaeon]